MSGSCSGEAESRPPRALFLGRAAGSAPGSASAGAGSGLTGVRPPGLPGPSLLPASPSSQDSVPMLAGAVGWCLCLPPAPLACLRPPTLRTAPEAPASWQPGGLPCDHRGCSPGAMSFRPCPAAPCARPLPAWFSALRRGWSDVSDAAVRGHRSVKGRDQWSEASGRDALRSSHGHPECQPQT